jgi:hypothetical protein
MREIFKENKQLIILWVLCICGLCTFLGHYSQILVDFGREVYYPERILQGDILYKDLFDIYGALAYQINAVLYWIFGTKLSTLYGAGAVCSLLIVSGIYMIAQKFLSKNLSFAIGIFTIAIGVTTTSIFNFHFPYSWAVLYGLIAFLYSLYFLLDKKNLCFSAFLAGVCIACKYDFLLYGLVVLFFIAKAKNWKALLCFALAPILSFGILFIQGLNFSDLINSFVIVKNMAKSKTLTYFYQNSGIYFHPKALLTDLILFLKCGIPLFGILLGEFKKKRIITIISFILAIIFFNEKIMFGFLPIFTFILACFSYKKFSQNLLILTISALCVSAKVFWILLLGSYGSYYISILLIAVLALIFQYIPKNLEKTVSLYILVISLFILFAHSKSLSSNYIQTDKGKVFTTNELAIQNKSLIDFIKTNTKPSDKIVIFPEGMTINFLTNRQSDGYYNSMLPLYVETFGEDKIIEHFNQNKPDYFVLMNLSMKDYYFEYICKDYALNLCAFIKENYTFVEQPSDNMGYVIFKRK